MRTHRRTAALIATMLTAGLFTAGVTTAQAHPVTPENLQLLRECESGDDYDINTGNGYYGAYQFSAQTWRALGYEGLPHEAAPEVQDEAAVKLQSQRGWTPWPSCTRQLGFR
jgi:NAD-dependent oxidoreductase involved in siderophore biosynthesis